MDHSHSHIPSAKLLSTQNAVQRGYFEGEPSSLEAEREAVVRPKTKATALEHQLTTSHARHAQSRVPSCPCAGHPHNKITE